MDMSQTDLDEELRTVRFNSIVTVGTEHLQNLEV